jgi:hypothetical protein
MRLLRLLTAFAATPWAMSPDRLEAAIAVLNEAANRGHDVQVRAEVETEAPRPSASMFALDGKPAGTLLMMAPQRRIYQAANWQTYVELIYTLAYRRTGWNKFLNPNTGEFERVVQVNDPTQSAYETANLSALFDPSAG